MQHAVEDAPADSPIKVEVQGSTVTVSSQAGIRFAARAFGEGATIGLESPQDTSLRMTKDCKNQVYTVNGKSTTYAFTVLGKATSIVVGFHKPWGGFAPGKVYLVTYKFPTVASAPAVADTGYKAAYSDLGLGKCLTKDGKEPAFSYHTGLSPQACQELCDGNSKCGGLTTANQPYQGECFIWLDSGLVGSGDYYGGGHCDVKSRPIPDELAKAWAKNAKIAVKSGRIPDNAKIAVKSADASSNLALYGPKSGPIPEQLSKLWAKNAKIAVKSAGASSDLALYADPKLAAASFAPAFGAPVHFTAKDCGSGTYHSFNLSPAEIKTGEIFKVVNHFSFDEDITGGSFDVKVHALGALQLKHQTGPLCGSDTSYDVHLGPVKVASVTVYGSLCPITKGPASMSYDVKLASILPPYLGDASFHFTAKDQNGRDIFCVQANLGIRLRDSAQTDSTARAVVV